MKALNSKNYRHFRSNVKKSPFCFQYVQKVKTLTLCQVKKNALQIVFTYLHEKLALARKPRRWARLEGWPSLSIKYWATPLIIDHAFSGELPSSGAWGSL
ncbi:hypothetical protein CDAR_482361 [Caerostris darwini]|uniref:Uncharacterized protein n=1 Tax=Caerostris darwini TaxID=1538125 RepID=A0AAV4TKA6_9ARAC|nr:hypothetical protein CDAR_482361 [Caerostris darwini]